jgi:hypothetical protein
VPSDCWHHRSPTLDRAVHAQPKEPQLIILRLVLVVVGVVASIAILKTIGVLLLVIGVSLWVLGAIGRAVWQRTQALLLIGITQRVIMGLSTSSGNT